MSSEEDRAFVRLVVDFGEGRFAADGHAFDRPGAEDLGLAHAILPLLEIFRVDEVGHDVRGRPGNAGGSDVG